MSSSLSVSNIVLLFLIKENNIFFKKTTEREVSMKVHVFCIKELATLFCLIPQ